MRSDVLPVLEIGGHAAHIPYQVTWAHEHVADAGDIDTLGSFRQVPAWLERLR